jgi:hypothetical protein
MPEHTAELGVGQVVSRKEFEFGHGKFVILRTKPLQEREAIPQEPQRPIVYLPGHNLNLNTAVEKAAFDIQQIAESSQSEVISFAFLGGRATDTRIASGYPEGVDIPKLYSDKASDMLQALAQMREIGELSDGPLDVIAYSDGGPIALTMIERYPNAFRFVELVNSVGIDKRSTLGAFVHVPLELGRVAVRKALEAGRRLTGGVERSEKGEKLQFATPETPPMTAWEKVKQLGRTGRQLGAQHHAIARSKTHGLIANLLKRNSNLRFTIFNTEKDLIASQEHTQKSIIGTLTSHESRVTFATTGWDQHMIGLKREGRGSRLMDMGKWMRQARVSSNTAQR